MARVSLSIRVKTATGHPFAKPVYAGKGRLKPLHALLGGKVEHHPEGVYYLRFKNGKRRYEPVGQDPFLALDAMHKKEHALALGICDAIATKPTLAEFQREFLQLKRTTNKKDGTALDPETITAYDQQTLEFLTCVKSQSVTGQDLREYMAALRKRGLSHRTVCNHYTSIATFLKFTGVDHKALLPYSERPTPDDGIPEAYSEDEVKQFFAVLTDERHRLAFEFLLKTGVREREMTTLEFLDLDLGSEPTVTIRARKPYLNFRVKTGKSRIIPLEKNLAVKLGAWRDANPTKKLVFGTASDREDYHFYRVCVETAARAGMPKGSFWLHEWRDTFGTWICRAGKVDLRTLQHWMGHSSITMTERYLAPAQGTLAQTGVNATFGAISL